MCAKRESNIQMPAGHPESGVTTVTEPWSTPEGSLECILMLPYDANFDDFSFKIYSVPKEKNISKRIYILHLEKEKKNKRGSLKSFHFK